jgi:hypothetical protein
MAIYQAIETRYLGPTNFRSGRIKARAWAGSVTMPYDHALNAEDNHRAAALALAAKCAKHAEQYGGKSIWSEGTWHQGGNAAGTGYVFVVTAPEKD